MICSANLSLFIGSSVCFCYSVLSVMKGFQIVIITFIQLSIGNQKTTIRTILQNIRQNHKELFKNKLTNTAPPATKEVRRCFTRLSEIKETEDQICCITSMIIKPDIRRGGKRPKKYNLYFF